MKTILQPMLESEKVQSIISDLNDEKNYPLHIYGLDKNSRAVMMEALRGDDNLVLVVTFDETAAQKLYEAYRFFDRDVYLYPAKDALFYYADVHGNATARKRLEIMKRIHNKERSVVITTIDGLLDKIPDLSEIVAGTVHVKIGNTIDINEFKRTLSTLGYEHVELVSDQGQFCVRGGIIDIFPITEECPCRIELWGDEIDSIRYFDAETQRSIGEIKSFDIYPASELVMTNARLKRGLHKIEEEYEKCAKIFKDSFRTEQYARLYKNVEGIKEELQNFSSVMGLDNLYGYFYDYTVSFLEYFPEDSKIFIDNPMRVLDRAKMYVEQFRLSMESRLEGGYILPGQADVLFDADVITAKLSLRKTILMSKLYQSQKEFYEKKAYEFNAREIEPYNNSIESLTGDIINWRKNNYKILIVSPSATRGKRIVDNLMDADVIGFFSQDRGRVLKKKEVMVTTGSIDAGFELADIGLVVISESEIFNQDKKKRVKKLSKYKGEHYTSIDDIGVGDYVVHERHGIGVYRGIEQIENDGRLKDYLNIEYADGGKLFIPVEQLEIIGKYASKNAAAPKLNKLGGAEWNKVRAKVRMHVDEIASELIELYAERQRKKGHMYAPDSEWQIEFEELFPYEETPDQIKAIEDTKADMESDKIMDRLVCGDVGFGKTEVAIRAAFKAVQDSRQVAYLVPTTILAQQHYETFAARMKNYPVNVKVLSRFCSTKETKEILKGLEDGSVDIVIGTHKLLSKSVKFKNLGLLIIDEEQRFGVKHKETIKQMKTNVDVLTLTATPIPRTLHMSLIGLRDMSLLEEPPVDRKAIQTYVMEYDIEFVKEAINRELARHGQVYYVFNRVIDIESVTNDLRAVLPNATVEYAHGKMNERELENIMKAFIDGEIDVLVSTTIIETGLDIPNVNTIIIQDADKFGLSQLYQLRGRVGRSSRNAYAFLMYQRDKLIKEVAEKRLSAIREFTDLGSGYKIAMKDLEIRGAGNLLGAAQSGNMEAVGYDLYCKMLNEAIKRQMGKEVAEEFTTSVDLPVDAHIPEDYVRNEYLKMELYKRIANFECVEDSENLELEVRDRFGEIPKPFTRLLNVACIRLKAHSIGISEIKYVDGEVFYFFDPGMNGKKFNAEYLPKFVRKYKGALRVVTGKNSGFAVKTSKVIQEEMMKNIEEVLANIEEKLIIKETN